MDSPSPPPVPNPIATANAQADANIKGAQASATLSRVNQVTPFGSLTYSTAQNPNVHKVARTSFDEQGYLDANPDVAAAVASGSVKSGLDHYNQYGKNEGRGFGEMYVDENGQPVDPLSASTTTQTMTLDPRVQKIIDEQLQTSQGLNSSIQSALGRVNNTLGQGINYGALPQGGDASSITSGLPAMRQYGVNGAMPTYDDSGVPALQGLDFSNLPALSSLDFSGVPGLKDLDLSHLSAMPTADEGTRQRVTDAYYNQERSRLDPQFQQQEDQLRSQLMARGMTEGSEGWRQQLDQFGRTKNDAYSTALNTAIGHGGEEMQRDFTMGMQARQQGLNEAQTGFQDSLAGRQQRISEILSAYDKSLAGRQQGVAESMDRFNTGLAAHQQGTADVLQRFNTGMTSRQQQSAESQLAANADLAERAQMLNEGLTSFNAHNAQRQQALSEEEQKRALVLNELSALRGGQQVNMPQFQSQPQYNVNPAPIAQAIQNGYQGNLGVYNSEVAQRNAIIAALGNIAGSAAGAYGGR